MVCMKLEDGNGGIIKGTGIPPPLKTVPKVGPKNDDLFWLAKYSSKFLAVSFILEQVESVHVFTSKDNFHEMYSGCKMNSRKLLIMRCGLIEDLACTLAKNMVSSLDRELFPMWDNRLRPQNAGRNIIFVSPDATELREEGVGDDGAAISNLYSI